MVGYVLEVVLGQVIWRCVVEEERLMEPVME